MRSSSAISPGAIEMRTCPNGGHSQCCSSFRIRHCMPISLAVQRLRTRSRGVSSNPLPNLKLELKTPWWLLAALVCWLLAIGVGLWRVEGVLRSWLPLAGAILGVALLPIFDLASGISSRALSQIDWCADGTWRLRDGQSREWPAVLAAASRSWGRVTILVWRTETRRRWAILTPGTVGGDAYRRLRVRLRLSQHAQGGASLYNPPSFEVRHSQLRHVLTRTFPKGQGHRGGAGWLGHRSESPDGHRGQRPDASRARPAG